MLDFQAAFDKRLASWKNENDKLTRDACTSLLKRLKQEHLDPILEKLHGGEGAQVSFEDIIQGYNRLEQDFKVRAIGAKDVSAAVFFEFHPVKSLLLRQKEERFKIELEMGSQKRGLGNPPFQRNKDSLTCHECLARQKYFKQTR